MKIILSRDVAIDGRNNSAGETVDVSDSDGIALVNMGKAQPKDKPKSTKDRSVGLTTSDAPALVKRGCRKKQMAIKGATERAVFFDTDDFATASSSTPSGGLASTVNGIFDNEFFEVDPLSGVGVVSAQPRFIYTTADLPSGAAAGDAISIDSTAYTVRVIQPEGTGITTLVLEKN